MTVLSAPANISSKHPLQRGKSEFYRYYAGYPIEFAEWALGELALSTESMVFDPWNGSGTTVAACAKMGMSCKGYDINPVMVHLGRARIASSENFREALDLLDQLETALPSKKFLSPAEMGRRFKDIPVTNESAHSALLAALYPTAAKTYGFDRSKNPSWYSEKNRKPLRRISANEFLSNWRELLAKLAAWAIETDEFGGVLTVERADSRKSFGRKQIFDGMLTSPPYLTRIDYVHATLPEFMLLNDFDSVPEQNRLRRSMLGSPLTSNDRDYDSTKVPQSIRDILVRISNHDSKASSGYYHRFFSSYFVDLAASLRNISKALKAGSRSCIVIQPSSYKEIVVDLPQAVIDIARDVGLSHWKTVEFESSRSMSLVNAKAHTGAQRPKHEFAIFLKKESQA